MNSPKYFILNKVSKKGYTYQVLRVFGELDGKEVYKDFPLFPNDLFFSKVLKDIADVDLPEVK